MIRALRGFALAMPAVLAACGPRTGPEVAPPAPVPATPPPVAPAASDWEDWPMTPGSWSYAREAGGSVARFGMDGTARLWLRCDRTARRVVLGRAGTNAGRAVLTVRTSFGAETWPARSLPEGGVEASRQADDSALDRIAFSRGRFTVEIGGAGAIVVPAWAEPARVIEDCRG